MAYRLLTILSLVCIAFASCKNKGGGTPVSATGDSTKVQQLNIAFVQLDSLQNNLDYYLEKKKEFEAKQKAIDLELSNMQKNIQNQYQAFQRKIERKNISEVEAENTQRTLANLGQQLQQKQQNLNNNIMQKQGEFVEELTALMNEYMAEYNKEKNYDFIFTEGPVKSVLFVKPAHDITNEVAKGMNDWIKKKKVKEAFPKMLNNKLQDTGHSAQK